jgi:hypothetical protein
LSLLFRNYFATALSAFHQTICQNSREATCVCIRQALAAVHYVPLPDLNVSTVRATWSVGIVMEIALRVGIFVPKIGNAILSAHRTKIAALEASEITSAQIHPFAG